jgi:aspartyl-tRNA(Asn)/glutamyl-tRNA(Gln) amidotransferase subunit C
VIDQMQAVDTSLASNPMAHPLDATQRLRGDDHRTPTSASLSAIAPQTEAGLYLVPKVIE